MAELTNIESKLAEVLGLAQAAQGATEEVEELEGGSAESAAALVQMREEATETVNRCVEYAGELEGKKTAIMDAARETKQEATEMMKTYLGEDSDALDGFEFLTMAEAGEVGHWEILGRMSEQINDSRLAELVAWALPIQEQHLETVRSCSLALAAEEDALATA